MNILKKLAVVGVLALTGLTAAHAQLVRGTVVLMDSGAPGQFINTWTGYSSGLVNGAGKTGIAAGTEFIDYFQIDVPDDETVSFNLDSALITFEGFNVYGLGLPNWLVDSEPAALPHSLSGGEYSLTSGEYEFDIYGKANYKNAHYEIDFFGTPAVPEPSSLALLLAGLGAMGVLARRRKQA